MTDNGTYYTAFIEQELKDERERRAALDTRGQAIVTTSGVLLTLLSAVSTIAIGRKTLAVPQDVRYALLSALGLFIIAAFFGILATFNFTYSVAGEDSLYEIPRGHFTDSREVAERNIAAINVTTIITLRTGNNRKVVLLLAALFTQLAALLSLGAAVLLAATA